MFVFILKKNNVDLIYLFLNIGTTMFWINNGQIMLTYPTRDLNHGPDRV
jgi:hypothetical protein